MTGNPMLLAVLLLPLAAFGLIAPLTRWWKGRAPLVAILAMAGSTLLAIVLVAQGWMDVDHGHRFAHPATWEMPDWITFGTQGVGLGLRVDGMTGMMLLVVTIVSLMVHLYSVGYMGMGTGHEEKNAPRYFGYLAVFTAAMLAMVMATNLIVVFLGWEVMGLASYLLIGFWFDKESAANACKKAFLTTKVGDISLLLGVLTVFAATGTFEIAEIQRLAGEPGNGMLMAGALLIFGGAMGKSAQFFLHVWLPDAMEGPTPASSLIHAATMVAAGVYLVARVHFLYDPMLLSGSVVAVVGAFTALFAASIAVAQWDIKRVLAYSTISQLGYMMAGLGAGSAAAGIFHLFTHAFFKALLFMAAGSVIHGVHSNDMREMGGLRKHMPQTFLVFLVGTLALAGIPPLSGFWSKDEILLTAKTAAAEGAPFGYWPYIMLTLAAFLTAFYMFRVIYLTFFGEYRGHGEPHESPATMTRPMWVLAALCVVPIAISLPDMANGGNLAGHVIDPGGHHEKFSWPVALVSTAVALSGIWLAWAMFLKKRIDPDIMAKRLPALWRALGDRLYVDEALQWLVVQPGSALSFAVGRFDKRVVDGIVNGVGAFGRGFSAVVGWVDRHLVDGAVNLVGWLVSLGGRVTRRLQWGLVSGYFFTILGGLGLYLIHIAKPAAFAPVLGVLAVIGLAWAVQSLRRAVGASAP